ncbi:MAG: hypothetical protein RR956_08320, partial [Christensenella sp.]
MVGCNIRLIAGKTNAVGFSTTILLFTIRILLMDAQARMIQNVEVTIHFLCLPAVQASIYILSLLTQS